MSWLSDGYSDFLENVGKVVQTVNNYNPLVSRYYMNNEVSKFIEDEIVNKSDLRGAEIESFLSGLPFAGGFIRGIEGINQLEDLYNKTGKIPQYPGASGVGGAGIGSSLGALSRKIERGVHDLAEYYSGEDMSMPEEGKDYVTGDNYVKNY